MSDLPLDTPQPDFDSPEPEAGSYFNDIWETNQADDVVLPPIETDIMDEVPREIGNPEELADYWHYQGLTNDCALYAQGGVLEANGQPFDIEKYRQQGMDGNWYNPDEGTYIDKFGNLLEDNGVPVTRYEHATMEDMAHELEQGHGVVVGVDTWPIWGEPGGHALWVTGMEVGADGVPTQIICNDSGREDGCRIAYLYEDFKLAWDSLDNVMVATKNPITALM